MNLGTLAAATLLVGAALTGCTSDAEPEPESGPSPSTEASPTDEPEVDPLAVPTLPDGTLTVQTLVRGRNNARADESLKQGQVLATEDLILVLPDTQLLVAVERETGEIAWEVELKGGGDRSNGACLMVAPPVDATAIVVFSGLMCAQLDSYSLEDGSFIEHSVASDGLIPTAAGPVAAGGAVFWANDQGIHRIEPDGSSDLVVATVQLGLRGYRTVDDLTSIAGTDVLVATSFRPGSADGSDYYGLEVSDEGDLEEVWRRDAHQVHGQESMLENSSVRGFMSGVLVDTVRRGVVTPRMLMLDPETGETDARTFVLERDPPGGYPAWIAGDFPDEIKVAPEGQVFSPAGAGGFGFNPNVVRYDLDENEIAWAWEPKFPDDTGASGQALAVSEDGEHVYALWSEFDETRLVELDYETGRQQRVWLVPANVGDLMTSVHGMLVGDQLVLFMPFSNQYSKAHAVMLTIE
ncbi:MAG: hypothetical protein WKF50_12350 [Nocardioides sp.]